MRKKQVYRAIYFIVSSLLLIGCTVQKRTYQNGYYISYKKHVSGSTHSSETNKQNLLTDSKNEYSGTNSTESISDLGKDIAKSYLRSTQNSFKIPGDTCGDLLVFNDSARLNVKVLEITNESIKYKRCDHFDGPTYSISQSKAAYIKYYNGVTESFIKSQFVPKSCRDSIMFISGNAMLASVIEVTPDVVRYKSCNDLKGPTNEVNISNVGRIRYSDGRVVKLNEIEKQPIKKERVASKLVRFILGCILAIIGISILATLIAVGSTAEVLIILYLLFLVFAAIFSYSMGWQNYMPWRMFMF